MKREPGIQGILFDLGRVIVDFDMSGCEATLLERARLDRKRFLEVLWDSGWIRRYECGEVSTPEFYEFLCREGGLEMPYPQFHRHWTAVFDPVPILPSSFLRDLAGRYPMTLISNTNEAHAEYIRQRYDVFDYFRNHVLSYQVGALKPDRAIFDRALEVAGLPPEALIFIDDRPENIEVALEMGIEAHRFTAPAALYDRLEAVGVEFQRPDSAPD